MTINTFQTYVPLLSNELAPYPIITLPYIVKATSGVFLSLISPSGPVHWTAAHKFLMFFFKLYDEIKWQLILYTVLWLYNDDDEMFLYFGFYLFFHLNSCWKLSWLCTKMCSRYLWAQEQSWLTWFRFILLSRDNTVFFNAKSLIFLLSGENKISFSADNAVICLEKSQNKQKWSGYYKKKTLLPHDCKIIQLEVTGLMKRISTVPYFLIFCLCACLNDTLIILL